MCVAPQNSSMKIFLLLAMIVAFVLLPTHGDWRDFGNMVKNLTGKHAVADYGSYGCYCGFKSNGPPKDATDWCCFEKHCCYSKLKKKKCETKRLSYKTDYKWKQFICVDVDSCKKQLCECDKKAAVCFKNNIRSYNKTYQFYKRTNCKGKEPQC
ncbi:phospholipase A2, membrane associated-like [Suncus etruscus]|uniref:phospholipase A2, membrane associated-like n=1 Tax=Suncus etruscus TaxID=109475 RepID=UPI0021106755|nr:phospholipase A2, membrane associated-like [Suncus etruscus]